MTALDLSLVKAHMAERRAGASDFAPPWLLSLVGEVAQVLAGAVLAVPRPAAGLGRALRRDIGLE